MIRAAVQNAAAGGGSKADMDAAIREWVRDGLMAGQMISQCDEILRRTAAGEE